MSRTVTRPSEPPSPLVLAAQELEDELRRCEKAVAEAVRLRLHSEKNIGRAARELKTASEHRDNLGGKVNALLAAIQAARARAEDAASRMETRAGEIQARMGQLQALQARASEIATAVRELTELARHVKDSRQLLERLAPIEARVAEALQQARDDEFDDVTGDIASFREMLAAMRRKLESI